MAFDAHKNFAYSTVATAPSPANSGTSLVVFAGDGTKFPTPPFNAVVCPATANPLTSNAEIVRVTGISTDTFTITRTQESTSARSILVGDQIMAAVTAKTLTDIENSVLSSGTSFPGSPSDGDWFDRTDLNLGFFYKSSISKWLTRQLMYVPFAAPSMLIPATTANVGNGLGYMPMTEDIYVESWKTVAYVSTTNNGSNYYALQLLGNVSVLSSFDTSADTVATRTIHNLSINALYTTGTYQWLEFYLASKTGSPGSLYTTSLLTFRPAL